MYLSHPLSITSGKVIIDCDYVYTLTLKCIEICRKRGYKCLTFTCFHLGYTSLMKNDTTDKLNSVMLHSY